MRESDIRPAEILEEYLRLSAADARDFFADPGKLTRRDCPGCGGDAPKPAFEKNGFALVRCGDCDTLYVDPAPSPEDLAGFYRDSPSTRYWANVFFPTVVEARRTRIVRPRVERILSLLSEHGKPVERVVDVGAGSGVFLEELRAKLPNAELHAVEPGRDLADACRGKDIDTLEGFAEDAARDPRWAGTADLVTCFEVIEHVADAQAFMTSLGALARPGGVVLATGLCGDGFDIRALGARSNAVSPPHHLTFLSRRGVAALLARTGLEELAFLTPGQLDVDIVLNAVNKDLDSVGDAALRARLLAASAEERAAWQDEIAAERRSSHMWILAVRP